MEKAKKLGLDFVIGNSEGGEEIRVGDLIGPDTEDFLGVNGQPWDMDIWFPSEATIKRAVATCEHPLGRKVGRVLRAYAEFAKAMMAIGKEKAAWEFGDELLEKMMALPEKDLDLTLPLVRLTATGT